MILTGELPLGGIVNEVSISQALNISRGPVREAVQRLQGLRLVTREPYMRARVVSMSKNDLVEIFQLREAVEGMACRLAAENMSDEALDGLVADLEATRSAGVSGYEPEGGPFDLHRRIAIGCGNERIRHLLAEELYHLLRLYRRRSGNVEGRRKQAFDEHWQIVRAMHSRDGILAESLMRSHIGRATNALMEAMDRDDADQSAPDVIASAGDAA